MDPIDQFKANQKVMWAGFATMEMFTAMGAPKLVQFAGIERGTKVLDVACGTGVVALTAARVGAKVTALDLTPELIARAKENAALVGAEVGWHQGDAEALPFADGAFDTVVSQFGHMFAPRPEVVVKEMLRVLRPGGTVAFSTWPPELFTGSMFTLSAKHSPMAPPPGTSPPTQWGDPTIVRERLGSGVKDVCFDRDRLRFPILSPQHGRTFFEQVGPMARLVGALQAMPDKLAAFRRELDELIAQYFHDNTIHQDYLLTRARKV
jgi:SAM-dependent methyltransferase